MVMSEDGPAAADGAGRSDDFQPAREPASNPTVGRNVQRLRAAAFIAAALAAGIAGEPVYATIALPVSLAAWHASCRLPPGGDPAGLRGLGAISRAGARRAADGGLRNDARE
jgi:hypothetical protein